MRSVLPVILALAVAFSAAGEIVMGLCACSCGEIEELCPCGHPVDNPGTPAVPSAPACSSHVPESSLAAITSSDIQIGQKTSAGLDTVKIFAPVTDFPDYSAHQRLIAMRIDLLHGPPKRCGLEKTNTRLAALSTLRI